MLQGESFKKAKRKSYGDISSEWAIESGKREKVSRFTQTHVVSVGMVNILKANMYSLEDGEPSVFSKETVSKAQLAVANGEPPVRRNKVHIIHACTVCSVCNCL